MSETTKHHEDCAMLQGTHEASCDCTPPLAHGSLNTHEYREAVSGKPDASELSREWHDKPHRLVYDLCNEIDRLRAPQPSVPLLFHSGETEIARRGVDGYFSRGTTAPTRQLHVRTSEPSVPSGEAVACVKRLAYWANLWAEQGSDETLTRDIVDGDERVALASLYAAPPQERVSEVTEAMVKAGVQAFDAGVPWLDVQGQVRAILTAANAKLLADAKPR